MMAFNNDGKQQSSAAREGVNLETKVYNKYQYALVASTDFRADWSLTRSFLLMR
jgi:hypothetical protein